MIQTLQTRRPPRLLAWALATLMAGPVLLGLTGCGNNGSGGGGQTASQPAQPTDTSAGGPAAAPNDTTTAATTPPKPGMSTGKKVVIVLAGAALLYYLYKKHQAAQQAQAGQTAGATPQLYRSSNGGVYYRDAQHNPVWLTVPSQPVQVPADDVQRYAPDYQQYRGQPAPAAPAGAAQQSFTQYDPSLAGSPGA